MRQILTTPVYSPTGCSLLESRWRFHLARLSHNEKVLGNTAGNVGGVVEKCKRRHHPVQLTSNCARVAAGGARSTPGRAGDRSRLGRGDRPFGAAARGGAS